MEPTNNAAERALRPAEQWGKGSFGAQSAEGRRFVERIMTAAATCKQHDRNVTEILFQVAWMVASSPFSACAKGVNYVPA